MNDGIFLLQDNGQLCQMSNLPYESEDSLQSLLANHPEVLGTNDGLTRRWLLVSREMPVPSSDGSSNRWSVDHLFLDQYGVPTLVEVKRSTDSRIRREVVGQMLEYAANAVAYWPVDRIQDTFSKTCQANNLDPDHELDRFLSGDASVTEFWQNVKTNLQAGRIRLMLVADEIPAELKRIVEFLNEQMDPAEVLALELKQYAAKDSKLLLTNVIGQTSQAQQRKTSGITLASRIGKLGSKDYIRKQVATKGFFRLEDGVMDGYKRETLLYAISDLKNPKYCGSAGVLVLNKTEDGVYTPT